MSELFATIWDASGPLGLILGFVAIWQAYRGHRKNAIIADQSRQLQLVQQAPELLYEWHSNYLQLALAPAGDVQRAAKELTGTFSLRNQSGSPLHNVVIAGVFGLDPDLIQRPYRRGAKGVLIGRVSAVEVASGATLSFEVIDSLRASNIDLRVLFTEDDDVWERVENDARLQTPFCGSEMIELTANRDRSAPFWNLDAVAPYAILGRLSVSFVCRGARYEHVVTGAIGRALKAADSDASTGSSTCHFNKQGYSRVSRAAKIVDELIIPQVVNCVVPPYEDGPGRYYFSFVAETSSGGRFTQGINLRIKQALTVDTR